MLEDTLRGQLFPNLVIKDKDGNPVKKEKDDKKKASKKSDEKPDAAAKTEIPVQEGLF